MSIKNNIFEWFALSYPELIEQMKKTYHKHSNGNDNPYHMENDVLSHTLMVFTACRDNEVPEIYFSALLHDIGKVYTRKEKENRVSFQNHENVSMFKSIDILLEAKKVFDIKIIDVLRLIAWHGVLWKGYSFLSNGTNADNQEKLNFINLRFGYDKSFYDKILAITKADAFGRSFADEYEPLRLEEEFDFLENYIPFDKNEYSQFKPSQMVTLLIGTSYSGKSHWLNQNHNGEIIISVDKYLEKGKLNYNSIDYSKNIKKAHDNSLKEIQKAVNKEQDVIIDMTNLDMESRRKKLSKFPRTKYKYRAVVFLPGEKLIEERMKQRSEKKIPEEILQRQIESFELPGFDEFDKFTYIIGE